MRWPAALAQLPLLLLLLRILCEAANSDTTASSASGAASAQSGQAQRRDCKRLVWFTAIGESNNKDVTKNYQNLVKCAVLSAAAEAPDLIPHVIYGGKPNAFTEWFEKQGGVVHFWELSFLDKLQQTVKQGRHDQAWLKQWGAYLRLDIPLILANYTFPADAEQDYVLYTDADVMFVNSVDACTLPKPKLMAIGGEFTRNTMVNSGVLVINLKAYAAKREGLIAYGIKQGFPGLFDQTLIGEHFKGSLEQLPDGLNHKPYWGSRTSSSTGTKSRGKDERSKKDSSKKDAGSKKDDMGTVRIVHFHGPKPGRCLDCLVRANGFGAQISKCGCPDIYKWIFTSLVPDKGQYYRTALEQYDVYRKRAAEPGRRRRRLLQW